MQTKSKKINFIKPAIWGIISLGAALPQVVFAADPISTLIVGGMEQIGSYIFEKLGEVLIWFLQNLVGWGIDFFQAMLKLGFEKHQEIAKIGWTVSRDVANMFFILILVIIAFATILRIEKYGIKQFLPKVIIIALLINFSMVFCYIFIDISNIAANFFITNAQQGAGGQTVSIASIFVDAFRLPTLLLAQNCDDQLENGLGECDFYYTLGDYTDKDYQQCQTETQGKWLTCRNAALSGRTAEQDILDVIVSSLGASLILAIAAFIFFSGGIILVIRMIAIWFLVMIAPLALICYLMPGLRKNWESWWHSFSKWCFFAPAYAFFIWLASKIAMENHFNRIASTAPGFNLGTSAAINEFFSGGSNLIMFLFISGLLIGGLIAAQKLGIAGANTALMLGKKVGRGAAGWIKNKAQKPVREAGQIYTGAAERAGGTILQRIPGFKGIGSRMQMRGQMRQEKPMSSKEAQQRKQEFERMSPEQRAMNMENKTISSHLKLVLASAMKDKGDLKKASPETARKIIDSYRVYGRTQEADDMEKTRPDTIIKKARKGVRIVTDHAATDKAQTEAMEEIKAKGKINEVLPIALRTSNAVRQGFAENTTQREAERYGAVDKEHNEAASWAYEQMYDQAPGTPDTNPDKKKYSETYSSLNTENVTSISDEDKQRMVSEYMGSHNRQKDLPAEALENENIMQGVLESSSMSGLNEWIKTGGKTISDAINKMARKLVTLPAATEKIKHVLTTLGGTLYHLNKKEFASFTQNSKPEAWEKIEKPDLNPREFTNGIKDLVDVFLDNVKEDPLAIFKKMKITLSGPMIKEIKAGADRNATTSGKKIPYADFLKRIQSDPTINALG